MAARPEQAERPAWSGMYWGAWRALHNDRFWGAGGGLSEIYFSAKDGYAKRYGIYGDDFDLFLTLISAMDEEFVSFENARHAAEVEKNKKVD